MVNLLRGELSVPAAGLLLAVGVGAFFLSRAHRWWNRFGIFDGAMLVTAMAIGTAAAYPILRVATGAADKAALLQNLHLFREQIALYKAQHGGDPPLLYEGRFPQLVQATDANGVPGPIGPRYPYGPYLPFGIPQNPMTGVGWVAAVDEFPPPRPTGFRGWTYCQRTGQVGIDLPGLLGQ